MPRYRIEFTHNVGPWVASSQTEVTSKNQHEARRSFLVLAGRLVGLRVLKVVNLKSIETNYNPTPGNLVETTLLDRLLFIGGPGEGIPKLRDDVGKFVLMGSPQEFLDAILAAQDGVTENISSRNPGEPRLVDWIEGMEEIKKRLFALEARFHQPY